MDVIRAQFEWTHAQCDGPDEATLGRLRLFVDDRQPWGTLVGIDWIWRDLLVGLEQNWSRLLFEDWIGPPEVGLIEDRSAAIEAGLADRVRTGELDEDGQLELQGVRFDWEEAHDLARYLPGLTVPSIRIWSTPPGIVVETPHGQTTFPRADVEQALSRIGDEIAGRLVGQGFGEDEAVACWRARKPQASDKLAAGATGFSEGVLANARGAFSEVMAWGDEDGLMASTSWLALASACARFGSGPLASLLAALEAPVPASSRWDDFVAPLIYGPASSLVVGEAAFDEAVLELARGLAGLSASDLLQPTAMAYRLGMELVEVDLENPDLAALVVHGADHAPVIALNTRACGPGKEATRRIAFANAVSWLADAARSGRPTAYAMDARGLDSESGKRARRLLLPVVALEDFAAADPALGLVDRIAGHFIIPRRVAAKLLTESAIWNALAASVRIEAMDIVDGAEPAVAHSQTYMRVVS